MYIFNLTINVEESIHEPWLSWMQNEYIPAMLGTGKFTKALLTKVQVEEELGGITYSVQYTTDSKATLDRFEKEDASTVPALPTLFEGKLVSFATELQTVSEQFA